MNNSPDLLKTPSRIKPSLEQQKKKFHKEFHTFYHILKNSKNFLLVAHSYPDFDTLGSNVALYRFLKQNNKKVTITCTQELPSEISHLYPSIYLENPENLSLHSYDVIIACDSVDRGFSTIIYPQIDITKQITVIIDHHPDITTRADVMILDQSASSACELLTKFFYSQNIEISSLMATSLLSGILGDTGNFQHTNTTKQVLKITSLLLNKGAHLKKISSGIFANKKLSTLQLWGKALENAKINKEIGVIITGITQKEITDCHAHSEEISQVANMLATVPGIHFSLVLTQYDAYTVKGSLRAEPTHNNPIDLSQLAHKLGGGGHALASGFTLKGHLIQRKNDWIIL
ncbi:MAG: bifunctional oligoribonuclease/PAP phosphatase NrnA [Candidatus Moraniibacteriota bacterium]|nr:MAG: bifunctional oligoribonuclease/PAP phosphatase NrnA [Candidatus Moranbacteria bacterium]